MKRRGNGAYEKIGKTKYMKNKNAQSIVVLYHRNCPDGFGGAVAAYKKFGRRAEYISVDPETLPDKSLTGKRIFIIDTGFPYAVLKQLEAENESVVVIDHHISNKETLARFPQNVFDNSHSGAVLAWKYFHPGKKMPRLFWYLEDIDLWRWRLPKTREIISALSLIDYNFKEWIPFIRKLETREGKKEIVRKGAVVSAYERRLIERLTEHPLLVEFEGIRAYAVNSPILRSEIGNALLQKLPPLGIVWDEDSKGIAVSLRSNGTVDVSRLALRHGGGGHEEASGFLLSHGEKVPWKPIEKQQNV